MDSSIAGLIGAGIGALAGMAGTVIGQYMQSRRDQRSWLLDKKEDTYSNTLRYLSKVVNRRSQITANGKAILSIDDTSLWFNDVSEAQAWMTSLTIYCSEGVRTKICEALKDYNEALSCFVGTDSNAIDAGKKSISSGNLIETMVKVRESVLTCARQDLGKVIV